MEANRVCACSVDGILLTHGITCHHAVPDTVLQHANAFKQPVSHHRHWMPITTPSMFPADCLLNQWSRARARTLRARMRPDEHITRMRIAMHKPRAERHVRDCLHPNAASGRCKVPSNSSLDMDQVKATTMTSIVMSTPQATMTEMRCNYMGQHGVLPRHRCRPTFMVQVSLSEEWGWCAPPAAAKQHRAAGCASLPAQRESLQSA